jgi:hypothetical protein
MMDRSDLRQWPVMLWRMYRLDDLLRGLIIDMPRRSDGGGAVRPSSIGFGLLNFSIASLCGCGFKAWRNGATAIKAFRSPRQRVCVRISCLHVPSIAQRGTVNGNLCRWTRSRCEVYEDNLKVTSWRDIVPSSLNATHRPKYLMVSTGAICALDA